MAGYFPGSLMILVCRLGVSGGLLVLVSLGLSVELTDSSLSRLHLPSRAHQLYLCTGHVYTSAVPAILAQVWPLKGLVPLPLSDMTPL